MGTAYNYATQQWTQGAEAETLLIEQLRDTLELLEGPNGPQFFSYTKKRGDSVTLESAIAECKNSLAALLEA